MKILISTLFFLLVNISFAEDMRYYDVEIVIIENLSNKSRNSENWPLQVNLVQPEKTVQLGQPVLKKWLPKDVHLKSSYKLLKANTYQLTDKVEKISESKTQRVIFHTAWRQPGLDKKQALPIYFKREVPAPPVVEDLSSSDQNTEDGSLDAKSNPSVLEGVLRVTLARYLHFEAELTLKGKIPEIEYSNNPFSVLDNQSELSVMDKQGVIHLKQKRRRIRSKELHYLDHPVLGILILITPYEKPENLAANPTVK
ncbi:MAG: hypothetical protein KAT06_07315 [Gammaproteobacteria bacterium]|nr:hypothetical protein [Gammaproteobacteria bacterium]